MDKFYVIDGSRVEAERELVEALFTPWDKQRLAMVATRLVHKGRLKLAHPILKCSTEMKNEKVSDD